MSPLNPQLVSLAGGEPRPANVAELEADLAALWRTAASDPEIHHPVTRACALTLVIYAEEKSQEQEVLALIPRITPQNPCRAVIVVARPGEVPSELSGRIAAHCQLPAAGEKEVCCEEVSILARGEGVYGLDQVVVPLLVPGLPVYLWWRADRSSWPDYLDAVLRSADKVLVDSARFSNPETDLPRFFGHIRRLRSDAVLTDVNWARLTPWRELIAQCFDPADLRLLLDQLSEVRIEYEADSPRVILHRMQALLLAGWLASRLNWEPVLDMPKPASGSGPFLFSSRAGTVKIECAPRPLEGGGRGFGFSITMKAGQPLPATLYLGRGVDGKVTLTRCDVPGSRSLERSVRLEVRDEVELINEEIRFSGRDRVYEGALEVVARLMQVAI